MCVPSTRARLNDLLEDPASYKVLTANIQLIHFAPAQLRAMPLRDVILQRYRGDEEAARTLIEKLDRELAELV